MFSANSYYITAPAQMHVTDARMYMAPPMAPAIHITAPAQPHATKAVAMALFNSFLQFESFEVISFMYFVL